MLLVYKNWLDVRRACLIEIFLKLPKTHSQNLDFKYLNAWQFLIQRQKFVSSQFNNINFSDQFYWKQTKVYLNWAMGKLVLTLKAPKKADDKIYVCKILKNILTQLIYIKNLKKESKQCKSRYSSS